MQQLRRWQGEKLVNLLSPVLDPILWNFLIKRMVYWYKLLSVIHKRMMLIALFEAIRSNIHPKEKSSWRGN